MHRGNVYNSYQISILMSINVFIIHGTGGNPNGNWFPWLKKELEKLNYKVFIPKFPTPKDQNLDKWLKILNNHNKDIDENTIFIGHSLGSAFILDYLERSSKKIKSAYLIAGFIGFLNNKHFDDLNGSFTNKDFNWDKIMKNCSKFYIISSDNDPYVPLAKGKELANKLDSNLILIKNAGHINSDSGFIKFDFLLDKISKKLQ